MALYLVTGGAGFIGSHISAELVSRGEQVRVLDDLSTGKLENLAPVAQKVEMIKGSICDRDTVNRAMQGVDYVLHQAARTSVPKSVADPEASHNVNANGTLTVLQAAREHQVRRVVFASSSSVYGETPELPKHEKLPTSPTSPYGASKLAGESYAIAWHRVFGVPAVALRYFNVFGPRQDPTSEYSAVIPKFIRALSRREAPTIFGDGSQSRDFTYVSDVVDANLAACLRDEAVGHIMNIACGDRHTLLELCKALGGLLKCDVPPVLRPPRTGDIKHSLASVDRARSLLGYAPRVTWIEGLKRTVEWYLSVAPASRPADAA